MADVLAKEGLERIDDAGAAFDPTVHDAVEHAPADDRRHRWRRPAPTGAGTAAGPGGGRVLRPGYRWKGRVIRPAMVRARVSPRKGPESGGRRSRHEEVNGGRAA